MTYEVHIKGREQVAPRFASFPAAEKYAQTEAQRLGREVRVYDLRCGVYAKPVARYNRKAMA